MVFRLVVLLVALLADLGPLLGFLQLLASACAFLAPPAWGARHELVVANITEKPPTLDPFRYYGTQLQSFYRQIYGALIDRGPDGEMRPGFLESWEPLPDNTWLLHLRRGVHFHDGVEMAAEDVKFSLDRILDPAVDSPRRTDFNMIRKVEAVDRYTIKVFTHAPYPILPARLCQFGMVLPRQLVLSQGAAFFERPIGAGPFKLVSVDRHEAVLERHEGYYEGPAMVQVLRFRFLISQGERIRRLIEGDIHLVTDVDPLYAERLRSHPRVEILKKTASQFFYVMFDTRKPGPLARREVRQALAYATNVEDLIRYVARWNGQRIATFSMPGEEGFHPGLRPYPFDPGRARALLAGAHTRRVRIRALATYETARLAQAVRNQWAKMGVTLEISIDHRANVLRRWQREPEIDAYFLDPTNLLFDASYHLKARLSPDHPMSRFTHPEATQLLKSSEATMDPEARRGMLRRLQEVALAEVPGIAFYQALRLYGVRNDLVGFVPHADTILRLHDVRPGGIEGKGL